MVTNSKKNVYFCPGKAHILCNLGSKDTCNIPQTQTHSVAQITPQNILSHNLIQTQYSKPNIHNGIRLREPISMPSTAR